MLYLSVNPSPTPVVLYKNTSTGIYSHLEENALEPAECHHFVSQMNKKKHRPRLSDQFDLHTMDLTRQAVRYPSFHNPGTSKWQLASPIYNMSLPIRLLGNNISVMCQVPCKGLWNLLSLVCSGRCVLCTLMTWSFTDKIMRSLWSDWSKSSNGFFGRSENETFKVLPAEIQHHIQV